MNISNDTRNTWEEMRIFGYYMVLVLPVKQYSVI